jgi:hypothetical protein
MPERISKYGLCQLVSSCKNSYKRVRTDGIYSIPKMRKSVLGMSRTKSTSTKAQFCGLVVPWRVLTSGIWKKLHVEGLTCFSLSPGVNPSIAVFLPERKGAPASSQIYSLHNLEKPSTQKQFYKADKIAFLWNSTGRSLLAHTTTDVDKTNKSYYGESNLYLLHTNGVNSVRVDLDKEGPVHDVSWGSESEFGVVYGYMPAKTTLYDARANPIQILSTGPRNTIKFSPAARFVLVAGFGNLAGTMDVFARKGKLWERLSTMEASNASVCEWSPDEKYLLTGTLSPRLRVDNGVRVWWVGGKLVYKEEMNELYQVSFLSSIIYYRLFGVLFHFRRLERLILLRNLKSMRQRSHKQIQPPQQPLQNPQERIVHLMLAGRQPPSPSNAKTKAVSHKLTVSAMGSPPANVSSPVSLPPNLKTKRNPAVGKRRINRRKLRNLTQPLRRLLHHQWLLDNLLRISRNNALYIRNYVQLKNSNFVRREEKNWRRRKNKRSRRRMKFCRSWHSWDSLNRSRSQAWRRVQRKGEGRP